MGRPVREQIDPRRWRAPATRSAPLGNLRVERSCAAGAPSRGFPDTLPGLTRCGRTL